MEQFGTYLMGLILSYLASLVFTAIGWIDVDREKIVERLGLPLLTAVVMWTAFYFGGEIIFTMMLVGAIVAGAVTLMILWFVAYLLFKVAEYLAPPSKIKFSNDEVHIALMAATYAGIYIFMGLNFS